MKYLYIYDCATGQHVTSNGNPVSLGNSPEVSVRLNMSHGIAGVIMIKNEICSYYPKIEYSIQGKRSTTSFQINEGNAQLIACNGGLFQIFYTSTPPETQSTIFATYDKDAWYYFSTESKSWVGPLTPQELLTESSNLPIGSWVAMSGMLHGMCTINDFVSMAGRLYTRTYNEPARIQPAAGLQQPDKKYANEQPEYVIDEYDGEHLCPVCWLRFDTGDVMSIASHPSLMGDAILGRDKMKRFFATQFNSRGQALDEKGMPCMHLACPHCRHQLPPRFLESEQLIFSIIGAPSSGKSYYLASLIHEMAYKTAPEFQLAWRDADPTGNAQLNDVSNRLFSASTPQQAYLSKTDLEGALYEEFYRHGRMAKLPKPFVFTLSKQSSSKHPLSLVFYDNAGEHFEPGRNNEDSPGAMHVAVANGLFFLFDPTSCPAFRKIITHKSDPQLNTAGLQLDQQAVIMAETETRIASTLNLSPGEKIKTPFAILIGKCDLWEEYLSSPEGGGRPLLPATSAGKLINENIKANSDRLRAMLVKLQPTICTTAESISTNVCYFAISQLGVSPETFEDELTGITRIGPDPNKISPRYMSVPTLWMLKQVAPEFVPSI